VGELSEWIHIDAIQALVHHASAVVVAIFLFALTARLITYLIPDGHAKKLVILIDDVILLSVFVLAGYRLLNYMWVRPHHGEAGLGEPMEIGEIGQDKRPDFEIGKTLAQCRALFGASDELAHCLERKMAQTQQTLNESGGQMLAEIKAEDHAGAKNEENTAFQSAQQAFLQYREAECKWRGAAAADGNAGDTYMGCMSDLAAARARQIRTLLK
jgi:uncharacterized protein YecT (DUF1311 family)